MVSTCKYSTIASFMIAVGKSVFRVKTRVLHWLLRRVYTKRSPKVKNNLEWFLCSLNWVQGSKLTK